MADNNTKLWDQLCRVPPEHLKGFTRAGGFKGTAIKPMWSIHKVTEVLGPIGVAWGVGEPMFQTINGNNGEILVFCYVPVWHGHSGQRFYGVGGDKVVKYTRADEKYNRPERWENDDEAFKKAFTDAVTNALKHLGVGADVHMGLWDGNKYIDEQKEQEAPAAPKQAYERNGIVRDAYAKLQKDIRAIEGHGTATVEDLALYWKNNQSTITKLPADWLAELESLKDEVKFNLQAKLLGSG